MQRRDVLRFLGTAALGPLLIPFPASERWRVGRALHTRAVVSRPGQALTEEQLDLVRALGEAIIPATDTPGAVEVGAPEFVDLLLAEWYPASDREETIAGLNALDARCQERFGRGFAEVSGEDRSTFLATIDGVRGERGSAEAAYARIKDGLIFGFVTSREISELTRTTPIIPGRFDGCIPLRTPS